jgi:putative endonuclease
VCEDAGTLVAVEVKTRRGGGFGLPQEAVGWRKREKLRRLLEAFQSATGRQSQPCRIDVVALILDADLGLRRVEHIRNAVEGSG